MRRLIFGIIALLAASLLSLTAAQAAFKLEGRPKVAMLHLATVDDGGWSEALDRARVRTEEALGLKIAHVEKVPEDGAIVLQLVDRYVRQGYNIIIGTSWGYGEAFLRAARKYPHVAFLNCAGATAAYQSGELLRPHLSGLVPGRHHRRPPDPNREDRRHRGLSDGPRDVGPQRLPARGPVGESGRRDDRPLRQHLVRPDQGNAGGREPAGAGSRRAGIEPERAGAAPRLPEPRQVVGRLSDRHVRGSAEGRRDLDGLQVGGVSDPNHPGDRQRHLDARAAGLVEGSRRRCPGCGPHRVLGAARGGGGRPSGRGRR